ncbi:MAG: TlyA family RNA methyltransferase [Nitrospiraceae bacterium]|nr:TlyA family RNA methyltransferase [Nitrospiraceae bacterium]MDA8433755.1 TlyA family RNA methyltransferase [Nitrospiraceae bacterium]
MKKRERLDKLLVDRGLAGSRERAKALIMEGKVVVDGIVVSKAGSPVDAGGELVLKDREMPYVGRGGLKLEAALRHFNIDPRGMVAMDVGCSTGGFTDCLLKNNAEKVYAIDVGYGQFDWSLRKDPRVTLIEKTNIRYLEPKAVPEEIDLVVIDVSFISLLKVLPRVAEFMCPGGKVLALIKPQFEVGKGMVGKGGVVRDETKRLSAVEGVREGAAALGYTALGVYESPVQGQKGNREYFIYLGRN